MASTRTKSKFVCQNCGRQSPRYMGRCPSCSEFNTMVEEFVEVTKVGGKTTTRERVVLPHSQPQKLSDISQDATKRWTIPIGEMNRVMGGGLVPGSIILIGGDPGIGKCVSENTYISSDKGFIQVKSVKPDQTIVDDFVPLEIGVQSIDGLRQTSHFYDSGVKPTQRIETRMCYQLQATYTHPVLTLSPQGQKCWKTMQDIQVGDFVAIQRHGAVWGNFTELPVFEFEAHGNSIHPRFPTQLDIETAYVFGLLIGDGCLTAASSAQLTANDPEIINTYRHWAETLNLHMSVTKKSGTTAVMCRIGNRILMRWLDKLGLSNAGAKDKQVPWSILLSMQENVRAFLQGLFDTDGSAHKLGVEFCTISEQLARQVHLLLLQFGIVGKLRFKANQYAGAWIIQMQGNNARLFYERIGFRLERKQCKQALLPIKANNNLDVIPYMPPVNVFLIPNVHRKDRRYIRGTRAASYEKARKIAQFIPEINDLLEPEFYWDKVVKAEDSGLAPCYDLCVPETHAFVTNGIVSHNSTLVLQSSTALANSIGRVLYVSGEESVQQIKMRADRMGLQADELYLLTETNLADIFEQVNRIDPAILIIDSIQTIYTEESESSPGSVSQVRECASRLQMLAKTTGTCVFMIGHVTKDGSIAGPRVLEHIVDTVLYLEGDPFQAYRLLRSVKNRFGATSEIGVFEMSGLGMIEVPNPSEVFLAERVLNSPGTAIAVTMEGTRPLLVEIQALTSPTSFGNPRRTPNGVDMNRLLLISAVLTKRLGLKLHEHDIFLNVVGGMKVDEPASDLAMALALASSYYEKAIPGDMAFIGEVGLSGEIRAVSQLPARLHEAAKLGFKRVMMPKMRRKLPDLPDGIKLVEVRNVGEALAIAVPKD